MPSGNDSAAARALYDYYYSTYLNDVSVPATGVAWENLYWVAIWGFLLIGFFYLYTHQFRSIHRPRGDLYGATFFGSAILERIEPVSRLNWVSWLVFVLYAGYFWLAHILFGQVY